MNLCDILRNQTSVSSCATQASLVSIYAPLFRINFKSYMASSRDSAVGIVTGSGRESDHSPPTIAKLKKIWIYTSTPPYVLLA
jgi:hypothetical protein